MGSALGVLISESQEGFSLKILADQVAAEATGRGFDVTMKSTPAPAFNGSPVLVLAEPEVFYALLKTFDNLRWVRPTKIVSVMAGHWDGFSWPKKMAYLSLFLEPKVSGIEMAHVSTSQHTHDGIMRDAKKAFAPAVVRKLCNQLHLVKYGIEDCFRPGDNDPDRLIVPYNRVAQTEKDVRLHSEETEKYLVWARAKGFDPVCDFFHVPAKVWGPGGKEKFLRPNVYRFFEQPKDRATFVENARTYGMFLSTSRGESFGTYYLELLASGVCGVFLDAPWIRQLLPWYPYIVPKAELAETMAALRQDWDATRKYMLEVAAPRIQEEYPVARFYERVLDLAVDQG
jgi:hypothetical protein